MNPTNTPTKAAALKSHHTHQSGFLPLKKPTGFFAKPARPASVGLAVETGAYGGSLPIRRLRAFGECMTKRPSTRPIRKPPIWEKLSRPGRRPRTKEMTTSTATNARSLFGDGLSLQVKRMSRSISATIPKRAPDAPLSLKISECMEGGRT